LVIHAPRERFRAVRARYALTTCETAAKSARELDPLLKRSIRIACALWNNAAQQIVQILSLKFLNPINYNPRIWYMYMYNLIFKFGNIQQIIVITYIKYFKRIQHLHCKILKLCRILSKIIKYFQNLLKKFAKYFKYFKVWHLNYK